MGFFSKRRENKRLAAAKKEVSTRKDFLLDESTPFTVTEAFRSLKATLSVSIPKKEGGIVIAATSAYPMEGKTTVTVNLSVMFANSAAKVLLVDADIRKGRIAKYFNRKASPGLSDLLSGQATLSEVVHHSQQYPNLSFLSCGTHSPKPYELLESAEMKALLEDLRKDFDYIIIDTPPVLLIPDALAVVPNTDGIVLVCRHQVSFISDMARAINSLQFAKANILGVVVNDYKAASTHKYYGSHGAYYNYSSYNYTYEYGSTKPEETDEEPNEEKEQPQK